MKKLLSNYQWASVLFVFVVIFSCTGNKTQKNSNENLATGLEIGNIAPELNYKSPEGKQIALSSLRGKMVLIDFWASWCPPCRQENPKLVKVYKQFKNREFKNGNGFTVYSVSLDKEPDAWKAAIVKDSLSWENHVSDLQGWNSAAAALYRINAIPSNVLIDGQGKIIARNLPAGELGKMLGTLLK